MIKIIYKQADLRYIFLQGERKEMSALEDHLNKIPDYMFLPSFAGYTRTPEVFLNKFKGKSGNIIYYCHSGLWKTIYDWAQKNNIEIDGIDDYFKYTDFNMSLDEFKEYVSSWNLNLNPYEYQFKAAWLILKYRQSLSELATRAGKTLIAYMVFRYMLEHGAHKILMVVPSILLVKQGVQDFKEYKEFFDTETVWAKSELCESSNLTIGTYQSLVRKADRKSKDYDPSFFKDYDVVCVDEAHHLKCKSINTILGLDFMKFIKLKFGFTGTLPKEDTIDSFCCHSLMGPRIQKIAPMELVEGGYLARPHMIQIRIPYEWTPELTNQCIRCGEYLNSNYKMEDGKKVTLPKDLQDFTITHEKTLPFALKNVKSNMSSEDYRDYLIDLCKAQGANLLNLEQMMLHRSKERVQLMDDILSKLNKNTIVFAHHTEYLRYLKKHFEERFPDRTVYLISGSVTLKKRQSIINEMINKDNVILCASYGCCSTGITFKNIDYGIFAQSFKSDIVNLQSIGRLMLKNSSKDSFYLYDIIDRFPTGKLYVQGLQKIKTYKSEKFDYDVYNYSNGTMKRIKK